VIDDHDIWRAANLLVKRHGHEAALGAARRADDMLAAQAISADGAALP
jgi:hypothetical protein